MQSVVLVDLSRIYVLKMISDWIYTTPTVCNIGTTADSLAVGFY